MTKKIILLIGIIALAIIPMVIFIMGNKPAVKQIANNNKPTSTPPQKTIIKIAINPITINAFPLFVAQEKGFFAQNGLEVKLEQVQPDISVQTLLSNKVDYTSFAKEAVTSSQNGAMIKVIMAYSKNSCNAVIIQPKLAIKDIKTIAVASLLSPPHYQAVKFISENALSAEVVASGANPGATSALLTKKQADATVQSIISALQFQNQGYTLKILDDEVPQGLITTDDKIKNNPEEIKKVIGSIKSASQFIAYNPIETKQLLLKFYNLPDNEANQKIAEDVYPILKQALSENGIPSQEGIDIFIKLGKAKVFKTLQDITNQTVNESDRSKSFDFRFVKNGK
jgi:ABC-type nitrate/sulfonate/bicarbonate transport system substrate-binding protein